MNNCTNATCIDPYLWFHQALRRRRGASEAVGGEAGVGEGGREVEGAAEPDGPHGEERLRRSTLELLDDDENIELSETLCNIVFLVKTKCSINLLPTLYIFHVRRREEEKYK